MGDAIRVLVELGRKKAVAVAEAFDWPGWNRRGKSEEEALKVLAAYRRDTQRSPRLPASPTSSARLQGRRVGHPVCSALDHHIDVAQ